MPQSQNVVPQSQNMMLQTQNVMPQSQNMMLQTQNVMPRSQNMVPVTEHDASVTERGTSVTERGASVTEHDASVTERGASVTERGASVTEHDASDTERDASVTERYTSATEPQHFFLTNWHHATHVASHGETFRFHCDTTYALANYGHSCTALLGFSPVTTKCGHYDSIPNRAGRNVVYSVWNVLTLLPPSSKQDSITLVTCNLSAGMPSPARHATCSSISTQWKHPYIVLNSFSPLLSHKCSVGYQSSLFPDQAQCLENNCRKWKLKLTAADFLRVCWSSPSPGRPCNESWV
jgi:hypothetical protein